MTIPVRDSPNVCWGQYQHSFRYPPFPQLLSYPFPPPEFISWDTAMTICPPIVLHSPELWNNFAILATLTNSDWQWHCSVLPSISTLLLPFLTPATLLPFHPPHLCHTLHPENDAPCGLKGCKNRARSISWLEFVNHVSSQGLVVCFVSYARFFSVCLSC